MKHLKETDFKDDSPAGGRRSARLRWLLLGSAGVLLAGAGGLFLLRKQVAEQALAAWCAGRGLACEAEFTTLSPGGFSLTGLRIRSGEAVPFEAGRVEAGLHWTGLLSPEVRYIHIEMPVIRGQLSDEGLDVYGLERLGRQGAGGPPPPVVVQSGRIILATPAGQISARADFSGTLAREAQLRVQLDPVDHRQGEARLAIPEARLVADWTGGALTAEAQLTVDEASLLGYTATALMFRASAEAEGSGAGASHLRWTASGAAFSGAEWRLAEAEMAGEAAFSAIAALTPESLRAALTRLSAQGEAAQAAWRENTAAALTATIALAPGTAGLAGPASVTLLDLVVAGAGEAREARLEGETGLSPDTAIFSGRFDLAGAQAGDRVKAGLLGLPGWPGLLSAHGASLRTALAGAASGFDAGVAFEARIAEQGWTAAARGPAGLTAQSGLVVTVAPEGPAETWLRVADGQVSVSGAVSARGGGLPQAAFQGLRFDIRGGDTTLAARDIQLEAWRAGGRSLGGRFQDVSFASGPAGFSAAAGGTLLISGDWAGMDLAATRIRGGVVLESSGNALEARTAGPPCLAVSGEGFTLAAVTAGAYTLSACPEGGVILSPQPGGTGGRFALGNLSLPLSMGAGTGLLSVSGLALDLRLAGAVVADITGRDFVLLFDQQQGRLTLSGASPAVRVQAGEGPLGLAVSLGAARLEGDRLPAVLTAPAVRFDGSIGGDGLTGEAGAAGLVIEDKAPSDPLFNPFVTNLAGQITANRLIARLPLRLRGAGAPLIGEVSADIDILSLTGIAAVATGPLVFDPGGLQPDRLSGRLTGLFTDAAGRADAAAAFRIEGGEIAGTARLTVSDFSFQTTRLGRVEGVSGEVVFSDVMGLTTVPENRVRIGSLNPGIPLRDGEVSFQLIAGETLRLDAVTFPFAGGSLNLAPMDWPFAAASRDARLEARGIELAELVEILRLPDTRATGTVSGTVPVTFTGTSVRVNDAVLTADPRGGRLAYTGGATGAAAEEDTNARLAFEALRDLEFTVLEISLSGDLADRMRSGIRLSGRNLQPLPMDRRITVAPGQPFEFAMSFDLPLGELLAANRQLFDQSRILSVTSEILRDPDREAE